MTSKMTKILLPSLATGFLVAVLALALAPNKGNGFVLSFTQASSEPSTVTLNAANAPTESDSFVNVANHKAIDSNELSTFSYAGVKALSGGHCIIQQNGTIVKDLAAKYLTSLVFDLDGGSLKVETGFVEGSLNTTYSVTGDTSINVCGNFIKLTALEATNLVSLKINYGCVEESTGHSFGELIPAANGVAAHYECSHCGVAFNEAKSAQIDATLYAIRFFDGDKLAETQNLGIGSAVVAPSGTYRTFYNVLGYNAKVGGVWDDTLLNSIPNVSGDADYRIVKELKTDKDYLLNDLSNSSDILGSTWDTGANLVKSELDDVPTGASMSNRTKSTLVGTRNGCFTYRIGNDFFNALNDFDDTDYVQFLAKFPIYADAAKYNDAAIVICQAGNTGWNRGAPTDNTGNVAYLNGAAYTTKQVIANGEWQEFKVYVSELKAIMATVPSNNTTVWDSITFSLPRNAASPQSANAREMQIFDVEFHRIDITQNFVIDNCDNLAQIRNCPNSGMNASNSNALSIYADTDVAYETYVPGQPTGAVKTGKPALRFDAGTGGWESQAAFDISFIINNINAFDDADEVVAYVWGFNNYGSYAGKAGPLSNMAGINGAGRRMDQAGASYVTSFAGGAHRAWQEVKLTISQLKTLTSIGETNCSGNFTHDALNKSNWFMMHVKAAGQGTPVLVYSVELHHAA